MRFAVPLALAGCATGPHVPKEVQIPVPVPCIEKAPERPAFISDRDLAAADDYRLILELAADRLKRQGYEASLEAVIAGCL